MTPRKTVPEASEPPPEAEAHAGSYRVELPEFEGPLDLLLHLVQRHELDILDIPIAFVTEKYLEYIAVMQKLSIDVASEYLVMAATLAHIKSKMLLPAVPAEQQEDGAEEGVDPREELVRRLLEYQKYKEAGRDLEARALLGRDVFGRGAPDAEAEAGASAPPPLAPVGVFHLLDAFARVLERAKVDLAHEVELDRVSLADRIQEICALLRDRASRAFDELFAGQRTRSDLVLTFLALLEMTRLRMTRLYQTDPLSPIHVELVSGEPAAAIGLGEGAAGGPDDGGDEAAATSLGDGAEMAR